MLFIPVSYSNTLIVSMISATATDVRTSKLYWGGVFLYVHPRRKGLTSSPLKQKKAAESATFLWSIGESK